MLASRFFQLICLVSAVTASAQDFKIHTFDRQQLTDTYYSEGANAADINGDGVTDVIYGPFWFEGPEFTTQHEIYKPVPQNREGYADNFFNWPYDFNGDGRNDVLVVGFPGTPAYVYENPGSDGFDEPWPKHQVFDWVSNESPQLTDIVGDARPELVCTRDGFFGFVTIDWEHPWEAWEFHPISEQVTAKRFGHGLGVGDVNGDGRNDLIHSQGWFEQPLTHQLTSRWIPHAVSFSEGYGGAEMYAYDVDGDGDNDIITSHRAHDFGLGWYEQVEGGDEPSFQHHLIMGEHPSQNKYGVVFSELHSVALVDMDGDGLKDIVTGKTYWSHHRQSPQWDAGAVVYWFKLVRNDAGVDWIPYKADGEAGIGRQISIVDVNDDDRPDIVVGGMLGAHLLTHEVKTVDKAEYTDAQPKVYSGPQLPKVEGAQSLRGPKSKIDPKSGNVKGAIEGETLTGKATGGEAKPQDMSNFKADHWSHQSQLWWTGGVPGDTLTLELPPFTGTVDLEVVLTCAVDYGVVQLSLDDQPLGPPIDLYHPEVITTGVLSFPAIEVKGTRHTLEARILGANPKAKKAYMFALDYLRIKQADGAYVKGKPVAAKRPAAALTPDEYPFAGLSAEQAANSMQVPEGFSVTVGAAEPQVQQPIAMAIDDRGRVWIAEAYEYPIRAEGDRGRDRILIFEDTDGDGSLDQRKVFAEGLNLVSGLEVGFGGVWVGAAPYFMFIPDRDGDDKPDSEPQILLDGWGYQDTHETLNAFVWGPDGWLYGCHGVFTHSRVGKPGTPDDQRVPLNCAVWRYHPVRHEFDVFAHGTSNPWGVDFNDRGQAFITACVIPHLYHVIQGARYQRQGGRHFNTFTYQDIATIADHLHYLGATPHSGNSKSDAAGGGHAHAGAMIYLGDRWPERYRDQLFMNNIHGQRLNMDTLKPEGSGYVGGHGPDFLLTGDQASQILNIRYGPDGNAWMIDWYDMQACHRRESEVHDRTNGRIYKVCYGHSKSSAPAKSLASMSDLELAELALHANDWYVRHSRRNLQQRAANRSIEADAITRLNEILTEHLEDTRRLRAAWALHVIGELSAPRVKSMLDDASPYVRGWAIQLLMESTGDDPSGELLARMVEMAATDPSQVVRLYLASAAQRLPLSRRWDLVTALASHPEDATDHNLPLMVWYAAEPLADVDKGRALSFAISSGENVPILREFMLRRIGSSEEGAALAALVEGLGEAETPQLQLAFLAAIRSSLAGQRQVESPVAWAEVSAKLLAGAPPEVRLQTTALGVTFGDETALAAMRSQIEDSSAPSSQRLVALQSLLDADDPALVPTLIELLASEGPLRKAAISGLAQYDDSQVAPALIEAYSTLPPDERRLALGTLSGRAASGVALLKAIGEGKIAGTDLTADLVRQLQFLKDKEVAALLQDVWGTARESAADKLNQIAEMKQLLTSESLPQPDVELGRSMFAKTCMKCHVLYGVGYKVGPDLTGSNRNNLDYLLGNIVDPSAVMAKEYRPTIIVTVDGRVVSGLIKEENRNRITLQATDSVITIPKSEIEERMESDQSMMPDDQLKQFSPHEVRSLIAYLQTRQQTPMLATEENAIALFNGRDLTGWNGDESLWSVEDGELVGRSDGLTHNEWIVSDLAVENFHLKLEVKLVDNQGNSGIQFRSHAEDGEVSGYQADIGKGWWGKLYEEHGRGLLWDQSGGQHVVPGEWNAYEVIADGHHIRTLINGHPCVDLLDPDGALRGILAFQLHSGGKMEVRFRKIDLKVLP